jgi:cytochrome c oxidase subunit 3
VAAPLLPGRTSLTTQDPSVLSFAFRILLASLTMIFLATLLAYALIRSHNELWRTPEMPPLPLGLVGATILLGGVSLALELALRHLRRNDLRGARAVLEVAALCGFGFLAMQAINWQQMVMPEGAPRTLYPFTFYMLTGTHALHVVGGLVPLAVVYQRARREEYSSSRYHGVTICAQYWHYLGVVWLVLMAALWTGT